MRLIWQVTAIKSVISHLANRQQAMLLLMLCSLLITACRPTEQPLESQVTTPLPTLTLIAIPSPTPTPIPPTPTPTPPPSLDLMRPSDLATNAPQDQTAILSQLILDDLGVARADIIVIEDRQWRSAETLDCDREVGESARSGRILGYEVIVQVADTVYIYHTDQTSQIQACQEIALSDLPAQILIMIDPLASELAHIARRDLSERLGLHQNRIDLESMTLQVWEDSSLGCVRENQDYVPMNINGYLITFNVDSAHYHYHTDSDRILPCFD